VKQKNLILMVVAVACGLGAAVLTAQMSGKPRVEEVEVAVAAKNLPTGTYITKENLEKLITTKKVPKNSLTHEVVVNPTDMVGKRLARGTRKDEVFNPVDLSNDNLRFLDGKNNYSIPMTAAKAAGGGVAPGSKVDVLASLALDNKIGVFPLLVNVHVLEVNGEADLTNKNRFMNMSMVTLAITDEEIALLKLAEKRGCDLSLVLVHPDRPPVTNYDARTIKSKLESGQHPAFADAVATAPAPEVKPETKPEGRPENKSDLVKVLIAKVNIDPETPITQELIDTKLAVKEMPREFAPEACTDLKSFLGANKVFKTGLAKDQWVLGSMIGDPKVSSKPAPQDDKIEGLPKAGPTQPGKSPEVPRKDAVTFQDVTFHTASKTMVARYAVYPSGEKKLLKLITPQYAAENPPEAEKQPEATEPKAEPKKID
jgi:Flp pilus assembly protein CpaB